MATKILRVFQEFTLDGYVPFSPTANIDFGVTVANTFPSTFPSTFQTNNPDITVTVTEMTDFYVWIRGNGQDWNINYTRNVRVYPDSADINNVVMGVIIANMEGLVPYTGATQDVDLGTYGIKSDYAQLNVLPDSVPTTAGTLSWNDTDGTADLKLKGGNVTLQIGQEEVIRVVNKTGATLNEADFRAVRVRSVAEGGAQGQRLAVVLAQANSDANSATTIGLVTESILNNEEGFITTSGNINKVNTTGAKSYGGLETWADGDILYLDPSHAGYLTKVKPQAPNHTIIIGWVVYSHANNGKIFVKVDNGYELDELHNVKIISPTNGQALVYNSTDSTWINSTPVTTLAGLSDVSLVSLASGDLLYYNGTEWVNSTKALLFTGAISTVLTTNLTASRALISNSSGKIAVSEVTSTELGYVSGVTSAIQTQLNSKIDGSLTANYISKASDSNTITDSLIYDNGSGVGIGTNSVTGFSLRVGKNITGATNAIGIYQSGQVQTDVTNAIYGFRNDANVITGFTLPSYFHFSAREGTISGTVTNQYGFHTSDLSSGSTGNYGFYGNLSSQTGSWNIYMNGTANNYMAGRLGIGSTSLTSTNLLVGKTLTGATSSYSILSQGQIQNDVTALGAYFSTNASVISTATLTDLIHYRASVGSALTAGTTTKQYGFYVSSSVVGASLNYGFYGNLPDSLSNYNLYMDGSAGNYLNGSLGIGTTTLTYKLNVNGDINISTGSLYRINGSQISTSNVLEGTNLYFTTARVLSTLTGAISTVLTTDLTASCVVVTDVDGKLASLGTISITELGYLNNVTSNIQTQLDGKEPTIASGTATQYWTGLKTWATLNTDAVTEGTTNLYFTGARVASYLTGAISSVLTTNLTASRVAITDAGGKLANSTITSTELNSLLNITSNVQTQLNGKEPTIASGTGLQYWTGLKTWATLDLNALSDAQTTIDLAPGDLLYYNGTIWVNDTKANLFNGGISTVLTTNLTIDRALISNGSGKIAVSSVTSTELGYLSGVTSSIQTQLNTKVSGTLTTSYIPKATGTTTIGNSLIYDSGTNIAIGSTNPIRTLHVESTSPIIRLADSNSTSKDDVSAYLEFYDRNNTARAGYVGFGSSANTNLTLINDKTNGDINFYTSAIERVRFTGLGNVGIGNANADGGPILTTTLTNGGSGYTDGVYTDVVPSNISSTGSNALFTITVSGGVVTSAVLTWGGITYTAGDTLTVINTNIGGTGSGLIITVDTVETSKLLIRDAIDPDIRLYRADSVVALNDNLGSIKFESGDTSTKASGIQAKIMAYSAGTLGGAGFKFFTRGSTAGDSLTEKVVITSAGNVGIGYTSPQNAIHIDEGTATASYLQFTAGTTTGQTSTDGLIFGIDSSGNGIINQREALPIIVSTSNAERFRVTTSSVLFGGNNAGGTIPNGAGTNFTPTLSNTATSGVVGIATFVNDGTNNRRAGLFVDQTNATWGLSHSATSGLIPFVIYANTTQIFRISTTGNVSLGNTNNTYKLDVTGDINISSGSAYRINGASYTVASGTTSGFLTLGDWTTFNNKIGGNLTSNYIPKSNGASSITNSIMYDDGTNIGISTASPGKKLDISGDIGFTNSFNRQTASYTLVLADRSKIVEMNVATANNLTVPPNSSVAFAVGTEIAVLQYGAGQTTIVAGSGVTLRSKSNSLKISGQRAGCTLVKVGTDEWYVIGDLTI